MNQCSSGPSLEGSNVCPPGLSHAQNKYTVVSWNVGTIRDFARMCFVEQRKRDHGIGHAQQEYRRKEEAYVKAVGDLRVNMHFAPPDKSEAARQSLNRKMGAHRYVDSEGLQRRSQLFQRSFSQLGNPDIICLQEAWQLEDYVLRSILPPGYAFSRKSGDDGVVVWNSAKFDMAQCVDVTYASNRNPSTIIILKARDSSATICVASAHLAGFSLAFGEEGAKGVEEGDLQIEADLKTMATTRADLYLYAGDLNTPSALYSRRHEIAKGRGYVFDTAEEPTVYDFNLRREDGITSMPVRLDYICAKGGKVEPRPLEGVHLDNFNRPSDHIPISAVVSF
ncbi:MAG: endonuclease/exonuclease/phosphatase family protein [Chlamydiales bacterium]|nr:endonuclease/exonuclease/phosphatase family protein [Chlamydiales bacterium]